MVGLLPAPIVCDPADRTPQSTPFIPTEKLLEGTSSELAYLVGHPDYFLVRRKKMNKFDLPHKNRGRKESCSFRESRGETSDTPGSV